MTVFVPACALALHMLAWYMVSLARKNMGVADIAWGFGFVLVTWIAAAKSGISLPEQWIVLCVVTIWGVRLAVHVARRNWRRTEDVRYAAWRTQWGKAVAVRSFLQVFVLQNILLLAIASSAIMTITTPRGAAWVPVYVFGIALWVVGFVFEVGADAQLTKFVADPANRGKILDRGLWRYTRHPNYFGEALMWWGVWLLGVGHPYWLLLMGSPLLITLLVRFVSGVPLLERAMRARPGYAQYAARTAVFVPWFPGKVEKT